MKNKTLLKKLKQDHNINLSQNDLDFLVNLGFKDEDIIRLNSLGTEFPLGEDDRDELKTRYNNKAMEIGYMDIDDIGPNDKRAIIYELFIDLGEDTGEGIKRKKVIKKFLNNKTKKRSYNKKNKKYNVKNSRKTK